MAGNALLTHCCWKSYTFATRLPRRSNEHRLLISAEAVER
jgi:hypothetical protein